MKKLPKEFCIKRDELNPLWWKFRDWCNERSGRNWDFNFDEYYGFLCSSVWSDNKPFANEITLEEWNEAVNCTKQDQHYDNEHGSLYLFAERHGLNAWEYEIVKRIVRCRKKGEFMSDIEKTKRVIEIYLKEVEEKYKNQVEILNK